MIYGKRDAYGRYKDARLNRLEPGLSVSDTSTGDQIHVEKGATTRAPLVARIKVLFRRLCNDKNFGRNKIRSDEVDVLPSPTPAWSRQNRSSNVQTIVSAATVATLPAYGIPDRFWSPNHKVCGEARQTPSNLG